MKEKTHEHCFSARATSACRHAAGRVEVHRIGEPDDDEIISVVPLADQVGAPVLDPANFRGLVLGCIEAKFCK